MSPSLSFMDDNSESEEYEDSDSESEDPFTSHQARRQTASGSQRGAMAPFYNYPGAGWTPPFSSAPPLPWVTPTHRHKDRQTDRTPQMLHEEDVEVALRYSSGTQLVFLCRGLYLWATFIQVRDYKRFRMHTALQQTETDWDIVCRHIVFLVKTRRCSLTHTNTHADVTRE